MEEGGGRRGCYEAQAAGPWGEKLNLQMMAR